jgi:hypothetical protein
MNSKGGTHDASPNPIPPLMGNINGADTTITGKLVSLNDEWAAIRVGEQVCWVPKSVILYISASVKTASSED